MSRHYGRPEPVAALQGVLAARGHLEALRRALSAGDIARADRDLARALQNLDEVARELGHLEGPGQGGHEPEGPPSAPLQPLTERETEVLRLLAAGLHNRQIALVLSVAESTVNTHVDHIMTKLGAADRVQAAVWAARQGIAPLEDWAQPADTQNPPFGG